MSEKSIEIDFISPRISSEFVVKSAKNVWIKEEGINRLAEMLSKDIIDKKYDITVWKSHPLHPKVADNKAIDWIFIVDCLNFSFWSNSGEDYAINGYTGYWALCAAINKAIDNGIPITDPNFYSQITEKQMKEIFCTDFGHEIPLLNRRLEILRESGKVLKEKFGGSFANCVQKCNSSAIQLLKLIVHNFPSFRDESVYRGQRVTFYKRAQILVSDIWACFEGKGGFGHFEDIDELTMFADYRVPQVLAYFDSIQYSKQLFDLLKDKNHLIKSGDEFEVELRAVSIAAVERIRDKLKTLYNCAINSVIIDFYLWDYRREHSQQIEEKTPFHRVRDIYY